MNVVINIHLLMARALEGKEILARFRLDV